MNAATGRWRCFKKAETATPWNACRGIMIGERVMEIARIRVPSTTGSLSAAPLAFSTFGKPIISTAAAAEDRNDQRIFKLRRRAGTSARATHRRRPETVTNARMSHRPIGTTVATSRPAREGIMSAAASMRMRRPADSRPPTAAKRYQRSSPAVTPLIVACRA